MVSKYNNYGFSFISYYSRIVNEPFTMYHMQLHIDLAAGPLIETVGLSGLTEPTTATMNKEGSKAKQATIRPKLPLVLGAKNKPKKITVTIVWLWLLCQWSYKTLNNQCK